jgi:hypothetical protein
MSRSTSPIVRAVAVGVAVVAVQALMIAVFAWPATELEPRDLPVVVAGPAPAARAFAGRLAAAQPGAFEVITVPDAATADQRLRDRDAYAAFFDGAGGATAAWVLGAWAGGGLLLAAVTGRSRLRLPVHSRSRGPVPLHGAA